MINKKVASEIAIGIILLIAVVIGGIFWMQSRDAVISNQPASSADGSSVIDNQELTTQKPIEEKVVMCTQDAKLCDDGSYVSRTGPNCEFAPCPTTVDETENWQTYTSKNSDFSFKYPDFFQVYDAENFEDVLKREDIKGKTRKTIEEIGDMGIDSSTVGLVEKVDGSNVNIVNYVIMENSNPSLEEYLSKVRENITSNKYLSDFTEKQVIVAEKKIKGVEFRFIQPISIDIDAQKFTNYQTFFEYKGKIMNFGATIPVAAEIKTLKYVTIYDNILNSFTFGK